MVSTKSTLQVSDRGRERMRIGLGQQLRENEPTIILVLAKVIDQGKIFVCIKKPFFRVSEPHNLDFHV